MLRGRAARRGHCRPAAGLIACTHPYHHDGFSGDGLHGFVVPGQLPEARSALPRVTFSIRLLSHKGQGYTCIYRGSALMRARGEPDRACNMPRLPLCLQCPSMRAECLPKSWEWDRDACHSGRESLGRCTDCRGVLVTTIHIGKQRLHPCGALLTAFTQCALLPDDTPSAPQRSTSTCCCASIAQHINRRQHPSA